MFCPHCGAQNPDGVPFCGSCGASIGANPQPEQPAQQAQHAAAPQPGAVPAGGPAGAALPKPGLNNRAVLIGLIVIAAIVVIAIIVGVVTCGGGGGKAPGLDGLVSDKSEQVAGTLEKLSKGKLDSRTFFSANDDMRDLIKKAAKAYNNDKKDFKELKEDIQKQNPWAVTVEDDDRKVLDANDVKDGTDPSIAEYETLRVLEKPKSEDIAKIASEVCTFDKIMIGYNDDSEYFVGAARNDNVVYFINASEYEGVYLIEITCGRLDEVKDSDSAEDNFDRYYDDYEDMDLEDVYRK